MAYLLLWSSIERYVSLRYHLGDDVMAKISQLAGEPAFAESLRGNVTKTRTIYRTDRPVDMEILDPGSPGKSLDYYYQVRSNITHRGKSVVQDHKVLCDASRNCSRSSGKCSRSPVRKPSATPLFI